MAGAPVKGFFLVLGLLDVVAASPLAAACHARFPACELFVSPLLGAVVSLCWCSPTSCTMSSWTPLPSWSSPCPCSTCRLQVRGWCAGAPHGREGAEPTTSRTWGPSTDAVEVARSAGYRAFADVSLRSLRPRTHQSKKVNFLVASVTVVQTEEIAVNRLVVSETEENFKTVVHFASRGEFPVVSAIAEKFPCLW